MFVTESRSGGTSIPRYTLPFLIVLLFLCLLILSYQPRPPPEPPQAALLTPWDGLRPIVPDPPWEGSCLFTAVRGAPGVSSEHVYRMCVRLEPDIVSTAIRQRGRWMDCDGLRKLWESAGDDAGDLFVDAGANIGACTFYMLTVAPTAQVLAFEPTAYNLYYLTRTVLAQPLSRANDWRARLRLLPVALGRDASEHRVFRERGNAGNSVLDTATNAALDSNPGLLVRTVRLDDVLPPGTRVRLLKLDIQGFEMEMLRGATRLLAARAIHSIQLEVATDFLVDHGSSPSEVCQFLRNAGFALSYQDRPLADAVCTSWNANRRNSVDIVAVLAT